MALFLSKNNIFDELFLLFILALLSYALGRKVFIRFNFHSLLEEFIFASGVGWIILGCIPMILGALGVLKEVYVYGVIIGISLLLVKELLIIVRIMLEKIKFILTLQFTTFSIILWFLLMITVFLTLIMALTPSFEPQQITYHYKIYSSSIEMLSILGILLNNEILAKLIHFYFGILVIIGIFAFINRHFAFINGLFSSCIFYISSVLEVTSMVELGLVFYELLAVYSFLCWVQSDKKSWAIIMVIQVGFALAGSYHGIYCLIGLIPISIYRYLVKQDISLIKFIYIYIIIQLLIGFWSREFLPILPLLAIVISHFIYSQLKEYILLRRVILSIITLIFIFIISYESYVIINHYAPLKFIFGLETASEYISRIYAAH
jgi:hypothetical protein